MRHFSPVLLVALLVIFVSGQTSAATCREDWDNHCTRHQQCCSTNCWRGRPDWKYGVCKPLEEVGEPGGNHGGNEGESVISEPAANGGYSARTCRRDWDNHCTQHQQCCSTNCWRGRPDWKYGVCKPLEEGGEESSENDERPATGGSTAGEGDSARGCRKDQDNHCTQHKQCCSTNCWRGRPDWKYGVCKPLEEVVGQPDNGNNGNDDRAVTERPAISEESSSESLPESSSESFSESSSESYSESSSESYSESSSGDPGSARPFED